VIFGFVKARVLTLYVSQPAVLIGIQESQNTVFGVDVSKQCIIFYLFVACSILPTRLRKYAVLNKQQATAGRNTRPERHSKLPTILGAGQEQYSIKETNTPSMQQNT
jgi:hypothetical protein